MDERAQAFTLEGFIGAILLVSAVLFALQATVVTPKTVGSLDADTRDTLRAEADDVLRTAATDRDSDLSRAVRYWASSEQRFHGATDRRIGYGDEGLPSMLFNGAFGQAFKSRGYSFNILIVYRGNQSADAQNATGSERMVWMGPPAAEAVTVSQRVTLYDNETLTAPGATGRELWEYDTDPSNGERGFYPIPEAAPNSPIYNVVEVRVTVW